LPYFKDIFKDLVSRSDNPQKGINKVSLLDYAQLPGVLGERFFDVMDSDSNGYLDQREFLTGLFRLYCSNFDEKTELIFEIYDFDGDGFISKSDVFTIFSSLPVINF
jgi:Ca2+-binding EF-hand superfamily protein